MKFSRMTLPMALLCGLGVYGAVSLPAFADTSSSGVLTNITHNSISPQSQNAFSTLGLESSSLGNAPSSSSTQFLSEDRALKSTDTLLQEFHGTSRNIQFMSLSRHDRNDYQLLSANQSNGDPNIVNDKFHNVPVYFVTINGVNIQSSSAPGATKQTAPLPATQLNAVVDATNGSILLIYCVHQDQAPNN
jgi:hypothetical protein